jgi:hypothetical protein
MSVNLDEYWGTYYVSGWSSDGAGNYSVNYATAKYEVDMTALVGAMQDWLMFIIVVFFIALAFWQRSNFLSIIGGMITIGFAVYWVSINPLSFLYIMEGIAMAGIGLYMLITVGQDILSSKKGE